MQDFNFDFERAESYVNVAVSIGHFTDDDVAKLFSSISSNMIMERDTGFFIKLYDEVEYTQNLIDNLSDEAQQVILQAHAYGARMVEIDRDAEMIPCLVAETIE